MTRALVKDGDIEYEMYTYEEDGETRVWIEENPNPNSILNNEFLDMPLRVFKELLRQQEWMTGVEEWLNL